MIKKYKYAFIIQTIIFIVCINFIYSQTQIEQNKSDNEILWIPNKKLTWGDFFGEIPVNKGTTVAEVQCKIVIINAFWNNNLPKYELGCFFIKSESWTSVNDSAALKHEQLHFDIYEIYTRKIRKEFEKLNLEAETNTEIYNNAYRSLVISAMEENNKYDNEVYFNEIKQQEWVDNVAKELEELKEYEYVPASARL